MSSRNEYTTLQQLFDYLKNAKDQDAFVPFSWEPKGPVYYKVEYNPTDEKWTPVKGEDKTWNVIRLTCDQYQTELTIGKLAKLLAPVVPINPNAIVLSGDYAFTFSHTRLECERFSFRDCTRGRQSHINPNNWWIEVLKDPANAELLKIDDPKVVNALLNSKGVSIPKGSYAFYIRKRWIPSTDLQKWEHGKSMILHCQEIEPGFKKPNFSETELLQFELGLEGWLKKTSAP